MLNPNFAFRYLLFALLLLHVSSAYAQQDLWVRNADNGMTAMRKITVSDRDATALYKEVSRWMIKYFDAPEETIKARIEGELLKGNGYKAFFIKTGPSAFADFQYTYAFEFSDGNIICTLSNGFVVDQATQDTGRKSRIEDILLVNNNNKRKNNVDSNNLRIALNQFANAFFSDITRHLQGAQKTGDTPQP